MELQVDEEFSTQIPPLTDEEFAQLEENILSDGEIISPIITWNGFIVDGHNRYRILQKHPEIPYKTFEMEFPDRYAVLAWICHNQLGRRNLTEEQKKYLIGKQYNSEKKSDFKGNQYTSPDESACPPKGDKQKRTWEKVAEENHVGKKYVYNAGRYADGVDAADEIEPGIRQDILSGKIAPTAKDVSEVADAEPEERPEMVRRLRMTKREKDEELKRMREIGESLQTARKVTEESMLASISALVDTMMSSCNRCFHEFPKLLDDPHYRAQLIEIMQKPKNYIMTIETGGSPL